MVSTKESQAPQWWHLPSQRAVLAPHAWQTYRLSGRATRRQASTGVFSGSGSMVSFFAGDYECAVAGAQVTFAPSTGPSARSVPVMVTSAFVGAVVASHT